MANHHRIVNALATLLSKRGKIAAAPTLRYVHGSVLRGGGQIRGKLYPALRS
jgi:hypothetical protein